MIEASSGSTAISEAYFARMLGLPFVAVMPRSTSAEKITLIEREGGRCHLVDDPTAVYAEAARLAHESRRSLPRPVHLRRAGHRLARQQQHRRIDLRADEPGAVPDARVGRGRRGHRWHQRDHRPLHPLPAPRHASGRRRSGGLRVLPELARRRPTVPGRGSRIEGIGRPRVEPSFLPGVVDRMIAVPDAASIATARAASQVAGPPGRRVDRYQPVGCAHHRRTDARRGQRGSIVTLLCDGGERYAAHLLRRRLARRAGHRPRALPGAVAAWFTLTSRCAGSPCRPGRRATPACPTGPPAAGADIASNAVGERGELA